ncbi:MAG: hypothetical protein KF775_12725 [Cyclobacteriaceae bacterium]|nr:hypothetical protein [Cyclobacteriaceae bacterium]
MASLCSLQAQGCSDAGFCTVDGFKPNPNSDFKTRLKWGVTYGAADYNIAIFGSYLELNQRLNDKAGIDIKLTTLAQSGNSVTAFGLSDVFLNFNYQVTRKLKGTAGVKLPLSNGGKERDNLALPMDYQASLGTYDLILGVSYQLKKAQFTVAYQQPLSQNENKFFAESYAATSPFNRFQSTNGFIRRGDILLRTSYPWSISKNLKLTPSLLPIYHLGNDEYTNAQGLTQEIARSQGLTLNATGYLDFSLTKKSALQLNLGVPFIVREARPDGLTRSFIATMEYSIRF